MWISIKGWEDIYELNEYGEVRNKLTRKCKKGDVNNCGYQRVVLYDKSNGRYRRVFRHRLVAEHFIPNPLNYREVNHIDGDKTNNHVDNLEWVDRTTNERHKRRLSNKDYKPFKVVFTDGVEKMYEFKFQLADELGVTTACIKGYLHGRSQGYSKYGIVSIEYI